MILYQVPYEIFNEIDNLTRLLRAVRNRGYEHIRLFILQEASMTKEKLIEKIEELLKTDIKLKFLMGLKKEEIETLVACIRDRVDKVGG
jgi:hypothetical protein